MKKCLGVHLPQHFVAVEFCADFSFELRLKKQRHWTVSNWFLQKWYAGDLVVELLFCNNEKKIVHILRIAGTMWNFILLTCCYFLLSVYACLQFEARPCGTDVSPGLVWSQYFSLKYAMQKCVTNSLPQEIQDKN